MALLCSRVVRISLRSLCLPAALVALSGCPGPREAANPRDLLGEDATHGGVSGVEGTGIRDGAEKEPDPLDAPATRADCKKAHEHLARIGQQESGDPADLLKSPEAERILEEGIEECLDAETSKRMIRCVLGVKKSSEIDACIRR